MKSMFYEGLTRSTFGSLDINSADVRLVNFVPLLLRKNIFLMVETNGFLTA